MKIAYNPQISLGADEWISLSKAQKVVDACYQPEWDILIDSPPATAQLLYLAHDAEYVDAVMSLKEYNGFGNFRPAS